MPHPYGDYTRRMFGEGADMAILEDSGVVRAAAVRGWLLWAGRRSQIAGRVAHYFEQIVCQAI